MPDRLWYQVAVGSVGLVAEVVELHGGSAENAYCCSGRRRRELARSRPKR